MKIIVQVCLMTLNYPIHEGKHHFQDNYEGKEDDKQDLIVQSRFGIYNRNKCDHYPDTRTDIVE